MRTVRDGQFAADDGVSLFYRHWAAAGVSDRALVLFHRGHEHSGRWADFVEELGLPDLHVFAWDARGHGRSPGERGHAESFAAYVRDAERFARHIEAVHGIPLANMAVVGNSVGAVIAAAWVHDYAPAVRALVLASPALKIRLYVPFALPLLRVWRRLAGAPTIKSYVKGRLLTHDAAKARDYDPDPLVTRNIAVNVLVGLHDAARRLVADAAAIAVQTQVLIAGSDWVVDRGAQHRLFERLGSAVKERHVYPGFFHSIFAERKREFPMAAVRRFVAEAFAAEPERGQFADADRAGPFRAEYDALSAPLAWASPKRWLFAAIRTAMRTAGRLSRGIRLGLATGFDSGAMLDYVYRNRAEGFTPLGRLIDRIYLDTLGWRAIRQRKRNLTAMLARAIGAVRARGNKVQIVDIAAGGGRYVLEALRLLAPEAGVLLRDYEALSVETGRATAAMLGLEHVVCEQGDAFDRASLERLAPRPSIAIAPGSTSFSPTMSGCANRSPAWRGGARRRLSRLHEPALAPAARAHRPGPDQPSPAPALGHAPAQPGRDRRPRGGGRVREGGHGHRRFRDHVGVAGA